MIEQVLNKAVLRSVLGSMEQVAKAPAPKKRRGEKTPEPLDAVETEALLAHIKNAQTQVQVGTAAAAPVSAGRVRRSAAGLQAGVSAKAVEEAKAYIPGTPELGNLQSAIECFVYERQASLVGREGRTGRRGSAASLTGEWLLNARDRGARAEFPTEGGRTRRLIGPFEPGDLRWINSAFAMGMRLFKGKHVFVNRPAKPVWKLADRKLRLVVFGDWGSGIPRAQKVKQQIRAELDAGIKAGLEQHVIHLGDVYYSGWEFEYRKRFLDYWPVDLAEAKTIGSFNLNGNHDMFSGGHAYYEFCLKDPRFQEWQGTSSLFHLANERWQIFGLDTSWEDAALKADQVKWVLGAAAKGKKTILLSHHQYVSAYEKASAKVVKRSGDLLKTLDVAAWLWGHEHRLMAYKGVPGVRFPRCIGHSGVPVYQGHGVGDPVPVPGTWEYRDAIGLGLEYWAKFGFATLDFDGDAIGVRYLDEDGKVVRTETIK
jgi:hypothetical protein